MIVPAALKRIKAYDRWRAAALCTLNRARQPAWRRRKLVSRYLDTHRPAKLNIGCGTNSLTGWLNTEYEVLLPPGAIYLDATRAFPLPTASFDRVFCEHMIEHVPLAAGARMVEECYRVLRPGGRIRIATPRLEFMLELMAKPTEEQRRYADYHYAGLVEEEAVRTPARILNDYHRMWGHQFVYDERTLRLLLDRAGFVDVRVEAVGKSSDPELRGIENEARMPEGLLAATTLVLEGQKRQPVPDAGFEPATFGLQNRCSTN